MSRMGEIAGEVFLVAECQGDGMGEALCKHFHTFCVLAPFDGLNEEYTTSIGFHLPFSHFDTRPYSINSILELK